MATLFNTKISETYPGLIKTIDNTALTATLKELTDGTGNQSGLYANTVGDFKVTSILEFGSLKDTGENIIISKFVDAADGIGNNDNDTTIPTTAAIIDYVAAQITIEDLDFTGDTGSGQIDLDSQIFAIGGTTNEITTVASGQTITFSLDSTGVNLPDNSTAITQTAGDNSTKIATTSYVDTLDAASDLDITDGTNTGDVNLNTQSLSILGTTNEIDSVVSGQSVTIGLPSTINTNLVGNVTGNLTGDVVGDLTGNVTSTSVLANGVTATTQSSSDDSTKVATTAYVKGLNNASDLDFSTDSGSGAVVLNSETLSVIGTTNEIETSGSGQQIQIGLPSSISTNLVGNVTGNLTGNVTGDVTGDLTGNSAGTHTGAVIGNVTGNVTGDLTGNADTATAWETARDLSVTGQASATITGVDGTSNVSASITLDNNSVTSKVLTGLPTPAASSVLATDSIVQGIGKLQSQINGLAGGLRFMGSWDATNNNPSLSSGGGEATSGTTTSTTANKLVDSSASFLTTVTVGDQVINQVDGQNALVSNVDSDTTLSLDNDIMVSGEAYTIDNSPFITQGHYYVVNVGGLHTLNGISNWSVGDWVIAGANNEWTKLDHTQIDGTGTGDANDGNIPRFTASNIIGDSIIRETGGNLITVSGTLSTTGNLNAQGDFAINTDKFTTQASTGNTAFAGDFAVNTDKFTVAAASGNTAFAGDLAINTNKFTVNATTGDSVIAGNLNFSDDKRIRLGDSNDFQIYYDSAAQAGQGEAIISDSHIRLESSFFNLGSSTKTAIATDANNYVRLYHGGNQKLSTISTGVDITGTVNADSATFTGQVEVSLASNQIKLSTGTAGDGYLNIGHFSNGTFIGTYGDDGGVADLLRFGTHSGDTALTLDSSQNATFAGNVAIGFAAQSNIRTFVYDNSSNYSLVVQQDGSGVPLQVTSAGSIRMLVANNGNVGIGTSDIDFELQVGGTDVSGTANFDAQFAVLSEATTGYPSGFIFKAPRVATSSNRVLLNQDFGTYFSTQVYATSTAGAQSDTPIVFAPLGGNVGIGTDLPLQPLQVNGQVLFRTTTVDGGKNRFQLIPGGSADAANLYLYYGNSGDGTLSVRINAQGNSYFNGGNVGIGDDTPTSKLTVLGTSTAASNTPSDAIVDIQGTSTAHLLMGVANVSPYGAWINTDSTAQPLVLMGTGGNVGIGTDSPRVQTEIRGLAQATANINDTGNSKGTLQISDTANALNAGGTILFAAPNDSGTYTPQAAIKSLLQNGGGQGVGDLAFSTRNATTDTTLTERMRITSGGDVLIGTNSIAPATQDGFVLYPQGTLHLTRVDDYVLYLNRRGSDGILARMVNDGVVVGGINVTGSSTSYNTSSDYRLKENVVEMTGALDRVSQLKPSRFNFIADADKTVDGFLAHEVQEIVPEAITGEKDGMRTEEYEVSPDVYEDVVHPAEEAVYETVEHPAIEEELDDEGNVVVEAVEAYTEEVLVTEAKEEWTEKVLVTEKVMGTREVPDYQGIDQSKLVPLLVGAIQELKAEVDLLKQECKCKN